VKALLVMLAALVAGGGVALADEPPAPAAPEAIVEYRESGEWSADTTRVIRRAKRYVRRHLDDTTSRAAIVLDIDDTSLSNYACLKATDFDRSAADCGDQTLPAIPQTRSLFRWARERDVAVFFVTGRREAARERTAANLRAAGYRGGWTLKMRPDEQSRRWRDGWKARVRRAIVERRGFRILANVGDQWSDLDEGYAARRFKLPNPMYVIPTA
jgi:acid phosphatase